MTDPIFGRATPVHFLMLNFACWSCAPDDDLFERQFWPALGRDQKIKQIIQGRANLFYHTEQDFGVSLRDWHYFFTQKAQAGKEDFGYGHSYAANIVHQAVKAMIDHPERPGLEKEAEAAQAHIKPEPEYWWPGQQNQ